MSADHQKLLAAIDDAKIGAYGSNGLDGSSGGMAANLSAERTKALEYYFGLNTNPAPIGRSQVVDRSVYETISVMLPSLVRIFASSNDTVCKALPIGPGDEQAADQTTAVLNHYITQKNNWEQICADWIHDAMLLSNGYAMAYWEESEALVREHYSGQSDDQLAELMSDKNLVVVQHSQAVDEQATADEMAAYQNAVAQMQQQAPPGMPAQQMPPPPPPVVLHDLVIDRKAKSDTICIKTLAPEHCSVSALTPNWMLDECPYFEYRERKSIADLRAMGLEVDENVSGDETNYTPEDDSRNRYGETNDFDNDKGVMRQVWVRMIWVKADAEKDHKSRLYYVIAVGRTILYAEPVARIPVASMVAQPLPHRHPGMSVAETVLDIQDIRTAVTRGGLDNLYLANNGRHAVSSRVNVDDLMDSRPGGVVRMIDDSLPDGHIVPLVHPFAFEKIIGALEYFDEVRQNRTGASRHFAGTDAGAINKTASGTSMLQNAAAMRVEHIARMMAPAVESLFSIVHEIISKHQNKPLTLKLRGTWTTVDPQAWRTKRDVKISVGVGAGNKESMMAQLANIFAAQMQLIPLGLAGPNELHQTMLEQTKLAGFGTPDRFWSDPTGKPPPPPVPTPEQVKGQTAIQVKQMELQADAQKFQATVQAKLQELTLAHEQKIRESQASLQLQATNDARDSQREENRAIVDAQLEQAKIEADQRMAVLKADMDKYKADLDAQVKLMIADKQAAPPMDIGPLEEFMRTTQEYIMAPASLVLDPQTGKAVAVKKGEVTRQIQRGANGRAIGLQ